MRIRTGVLLGCLSALLVLSLGYGTKAQQGQIAPLSRVGVFSVMKVMQNCQKNTDHITVAQAEQKKMSLELRTLAQELEMEQSQLKTIRPGTEDYLQQAKSAGNKQVNLEALQDYYTKLTRAKERDWTEQLYKDVLAAAQRVAEAKELGMVFDQSVPEYPVPADRLFMAISTHKLIYSKGCIDINDEVLAEVDK
jgi:Skp family chaperone for outer membrane proteins